MTYDGFLLSAIAAELRQTILRGRVQKIRQSSVTDIFMEVRGPGNTYLLFISVDAKFPRIYLTTSPGQALPEPPNFCMLMRKYASGAFVSSVEQIGMDRILHFGLDSSEHGKMALILEIMGKHSNLILVNSDGKILGATKHVGSSISRYRQVLPGREYIPPPGEPKVDPRGLGDREKMLREAFWPEASSAEVKKWLMNTFSGFGPFLADEIVARSGGDRDRVREEMLHLGDMVRRAAYDPVFVTDEKGAGLMVYPMPSVQFPADRQHARASVNEALDALFRTLVTRTTLDEERVQTVTAIRRAMASRKQTLKSIARTVEESQRAGRYKQTGEIILGSLHAIEKGAKSVTLPDFFDPSFDGLRMPEVTIELDEKLEPQANAERYFKRYRKARDSVATSESRRTLIESDIARLESALRECESAQTVESLRQLRAGLTSAGLLRQEVSPEKQESEFAGHRIRRVVTPDGWEILYGENSTSNDYLTQKIARPNDVWLHARQITGAHVVIRMAGRKGSAPRPVLLEAARIAALNCDAKHSSLVPVDHTLRKYVHKPRASAPGFVIYRNEKTIDVNPKE
jgi:predicted ribosome quality control (RQC) complex YloA/Tae2 family protein